MAARAATARGSPRRARRAAGLRLSDTKVGLLFMLPFILTAGAFMIWPVVEAIPMAFLAYNPLRPDDVRFAGLRNFEAIFADPLFWESFSQALIWTGWSIVLQTGFGVGLALLLHTQLPAIAVFRGLLLFPYIVPTVVIALNWRWIFNREIGIINHVLLQAGVIEENIAWLSTPAMAMASAILLNVWTYTPFVIICVLARLQTIPTELDDAAKVDGARALRRFLDITLPLLKRCSSSSSCSERSGPSTRSRRSTC